MAAELLIGDQSCALFARDAAKILTFLGSGFFFKRSGRVLAATAAHCIPGSPASLRLIATSGEYEVSVIALDQAHDLCLLDPGKQCPPHVVTELSEEHTVQGNLNLYAYEYSTTEMRDGTWQIFPATRIGNCVRQPPMRHLFGAAGESMLELSFPAIRGASGAPVIEMRGESLIVRGIVIANAERHLLPAHIETVLSNRNDLLEERKYFLPQAVAVNSAHLCKLVDEHFRAAVT